MDLVRKTPGAGAVRRALAVLTEIGKADRGLSVSELVSRVSVTKPTAHRLVSVLIEEGFLAATGTPQVLRLGPMFLELAHAAWHDFDLRGAAVAELEKLAQISGHSALLLVPNGDQVICVEAIHGGERLRHVDVGSTASFRTSAAGQAIVAFSPGRHLLATESAPLTKARFYAIDDEQSSVGWRSVAAPVFNERSEPVAALSVTGPAHLLSIEQLHELAPEVLESARRRSSSPRHRKSCCRRRKHR